MVARPANTYNEPADPRELQIAIALWKANTRKPQYKLAAELGICPVFLSQIAHGIRPGYQYTPKIKQLADQSAGRRVG